MYSSIAQTYFWLNSGIPKIIAGRKTQKLTAFVVFFFLRPVLDHISNDQAVLFSSVLHTYAACATKDVFFSFSI